MFNLNVFLLNFVAAKFHLKFIVNSIVYILTEIHPPMNTEYSTDVFVFIRNPYTTSLDG